MVYRLWKAVMRLWALQPPISLHGQGTPCPYITQSTTHDPRSPSPEPRSSDKARLVPT